MNARKTSTLAATNPARPPRRPGSPHPMNTERSTHSPADVPDENLTRPDGDPSTHAIGWTEGDWGSSHPGQRMPLCARSRAAPPHRSRRQPSRTAAPGGRTTNISSRGVGAIRTTETATLPRVCCS